MHPDGVCSSSRCTVFKYSASRYPGTQCTNYTSSVKSTVHQVYSIQCIKSFCCDPIFCYVSPSSSPHRVTKFNAPQIAHCNAFQCTVTTLHFSALFCISMHYNCIANLPTPCHQIQCTPECTACSYSAVTYISLNGNYIAFQCTVTALHLTAL